MDLSAHVTARILAGQPLHLLGRLLSTRRDNGDLVLLDPKTGGEVSTDDRPAFILSTEREATDDHILRQHWNLDRGAEGGAGIPIIWNHDADILLGQWQDLEVRDLHDFNQGEGPCLVGRAWFDPEDDLAQKRKGQVKRGVLKATSIRWIPGKCIRRGDLDKKNPLYREPKDDVCGQPAEGFVMGSPEEPNTAIEGSMTPIPADERAVATSRLYTRGAAELAAAVRAPAGMDADRLLGWLGADPRVRTWAQSQIREVLTGPTGGVLLRSFLGSPEGAALLRSLKLTGSGASSVSSSERTLADLFAS